MLLDAAHITSDGDEKLRQSVVPNGIPLLKIHHAAFDAHLIGYAGLDRLCLGRVPVGLLRRRLIRDAPSRAQRRLLSGAHEPRSPT